MRITFYYHTLSGVFVAFVYCTNFPSCFLPSTLCRNTFDNFGPLLLWMFVRSFYFFRFVLFRCCFHFMHIPEEWLNSHSMALIGVVAVVGCHRAQFTLQCWISLDFVDHDVVVCNFGNSCKVQIMFHKVESRSLNLSCFIYLLVFSVVFRHLFRIFAFSEIVFLGAQCITEQWRGGATSKVFFSRFFFLLAALTMATNDEQSNKHKHKWLMRQK